MSDNENELVSAEEARGLLDAALTTPDERWGVGRLDCGDYYASHIGSTVRGKSVTGQFMGGHEAMRLLAAAPDLARTVIALHTRAEQAERERDEAIELLEGIPTWGPYRWRDVPETVRLKLRGNSDQIGRLIKERDAARTILDGEIRVRSKRVRERDEARAERDRLRDVVEHAARTGSDATFRVAVCKGAGSGEKLTLVVTGPADREENMARSVAGLICATMSLAMDERDVELRDAVAERDRLAREVERLERALRVENGDPFAGPDGWTPTTRGWRRADMLVTRRWMFGTCVRVALDEDGHIIDGSATDHPNAWDAMTQFGDEEAADAAREVTRG